jgi:glycosyltransferase involved in cell wall biosynthesis
MKIGIDIRSLQEKQKSGVGEFTYELLAALFKIDQHNEYYLFSNAFHVNGIDLPPFDKARVKHCHFNFPNKLLNFCFRFFDRPKIDNLLGVKLDKFIFPNINFYAVNSSTEKVLVVHDLSYELFPSFYSPKGRLWHKMIGSKKFCHEADRIVAVSQKTKQDLIDFFNIDADKIFPIYPGIAEKMKRVNDEADLSRVREKYHLPQKFILYLGTVEPRKNISTLVKAFKQIQSEIDYRLVIAGAKGFKGSDILKNNSQIQYIGYVNSKDKPALYTLADLFVYPSFYEGFGFPPLEALACGTPVVASHAGSLGEVLGQAALLVNPHNATELSQAIKNVMSDQELKNQLLRKAGLAINQYSWGKTASQWLEKIIIKSF